MAAPGENFIFRYLPANHPRSNIWDAACVVRKNGDGTWNSWLMANEHWYNGSDLNTLTYSCESWWIQGLQRCRIYRGQFDDIASRYDGGGIHYPPGGSYYPYISNMCVGWRTFGHTTPASQDYIRWQVPAGMTHFRVWATLYDSANPCDLTMIQQDSGWAQVSSDTYPFVDTESKKTPRPSAWVALDGSAAFIKTINAAVNAAADFILIGIEFVDKNTAVDPDYGGWPAMWDSDGGDAKDLLSFPDPNNRGYSSVDIACYNQKTTDSYPTTEPGGSDSPQFGGVSHKGGYNGTLAITVNGVAWNSKTGSPVKGKIVITTTRDISNDYIKTPTYSGDQYKIGKLTIIYTFDRWRLGIERTFENTGMATRSLWGLYAVLLSTPITCDSVQFGNGPTQEPPESGIPVDGNLGDRSVRIEDSTLSVVWIGNYTIGRDVEGGGMPPRMYWNTTFLRTYIMFASNGEFSAPYNIGVGESVTWSSDYFVFNAEDEWRIRSSQFRQPLRSRFSTGIRGRL